MAQTRWKVYRGKEHIASCKHAEDAAALLIEGDKILDGDWPGRPVVWTEGVDGSDSGDNRDVVAGIIYDRTAARLEAYKKTCVPTRLGDAFGR